MGIEDIQISEELKTNAPSIKYSGNEGPKSPQEMEKMMMAQLEEEYLKYVDDMMEQGLEPMTLEQFMQQAIAEGDMAGGNPLPQDPTKPVNPFQPKPTGPTLPNRQMAAYGGIMGVDGRKQYGIGSWFQKAKDKVVDDLIPNEIKENPLVTAAILAGGYDLTRDNSLIKKGLSGVTDYLLGPKEYDDSEHGDSKSRSGGALEKITGIKTGENRTLGGDILGSISKNIVPIVGGLTAGLFTKNQPDQPTGMPNDNTALNLAEYKKAANLLDQKQGLAADMNFLPTVASRKYSPAEMAVTYAQAANGGRIGFNMGGGADMGSPQMGGIQTFMRSNSGTDYVTTVMESLYQQNQDKYQSPEDPQLVQDALIMVQKSIAPFKLSESRMKNNLNRINRAEGGIMDLGGLEKDYRAEGGFVPIGKAEKADDVPARLSVNEFVFTADAVRNAGGGDIDEGARVMENMMKHLEAGGQVSEESQGMQGARDMFATSERLSEVI